MLARNCCLLALLHLAVAHDRPDAGSFFADFDQLPTARPSANTQLRSEQEERRVNYFRRRAQKTPELRRFSKPGLFPQLQRKPDPEEERLKNKDNLSLNNQNNGNENVNLRIENDKDISFPNHENNNRFPNDQNDINRQRYYSRHRLRPSTHINDPDRTDHLSGESFKADVNDNSNVQEPPLFRQRLALGLPARNKVYIDETNQDAPFFHSSRKKKMFENNQDSRDEQNLPDGFLHLKEGPQSLQDFYENWRQQQIQFPQNVNQIYRDQTKENVPMIKANDRTTDSERTSKEFANGFLTDQEDRLIQNVQEPKQYTQNPKVNSWESGVEDKLLVNNKNDPLKPTIRDENKEAETGHIERSFKDSEGTFLTNFDDPFLNKDHIFRQLSHSNIHDRNPINFVESFLPNEDSFTKKDRIYFPSQSQDNRENTRRSEETFLTDREEYPEFQSKPHHEPFQPENRPEKEQESPTKSPETFLTDEDDSLGLIPRPIIVNDVQSTNSPINRESTPSRSEESFLTDEGTLPAKEEAYIPATLPPTSSNENSIIRKDDFLKDDKPILLRERNQPSNIGRVRWPPPKNSESAESSSREQPFLKPLFYEDFKLNSRGSESDEHRSGNSRRQGQSFNEEDSESDEREDEKRPDTSDDGRPPIYDDHHPFLDFEDSSEKSPPTQEDRNNMNEYLNSPAKNDDGEEREDEEEKENDRRKGHNEHPPVQSLYDSEEEDEHAPLNELDSDESPYSNPHRVPHENIQDESPHDYDQEDTPPHRGHDEDESIPQDHNEKESPPRGYGEEESPPTLSNDESPLPAKGSEASPHPSPPYQHKVTRPGHSQEEPLSDDSKEEPFPGHSHEAQQPDHSKEQSLTGHSHEDQETYHSDEESPPDHSHEESPSDHSKEESPPVHSREEFHPSHSHEEPTSNQSHEESPPAQSHEESPPPSHSHEESPQSEESHEELPPSITAYSETPSENNIDSDEHSPGGSHESEESSSPSQEDEEKPPLDYDERPPDYESIKPTPEYEDGGTRSEEHVSGSTEAGPEANEEGVNYEDEGPDHSEEESDYEEGPEPTSTPATDYEDSSSKPAGEQSEEEEDNSGSPEFNFDSFEFPMDAMETPPSSGKGATTTRRPVSTLRPTSLPEDCPDGPTTPRLDLTKAKRPTNTVRPSARPADEVSITMGDTMKLSRPSSAGTSSTTTQRPVSISALGVVKPGGQIIAKVVRPTVTSSTTTRAPSTSSRPTLRSARIRAGVPFGARVKAISSASSSTTAMPTQQMKAALAAREATALTYLKPPPLGQPHTWLQTPLPSSPMLKLFVI